MWGDRIGVKNSRRQRGEGERHGYHLIAGPHAEGWARRRDPAGGSVGVFNPHELTRLISEAIEASTISPSLLESGMI